MSSASTRAGYPTGGTAATVTRSPLRLAWHVSGQVERSLTVPRRQQRVQRLDVGGA